MKTREREIVRAMRRNEGRSIQTIYGAIQEYGGFDRPEWLD
jgi:hypothetical protein